MAKPLTKESLITDPNIKKGKFELALDTETFNQLVRFIVLTNEGKGRNEFINSLIKRELDGKVLDNTFINIYDKPFYFNKKELIEKGETIATQILLDNDLEESVKIFKIPNNLDDLHPNYKTYCYGDSETTHAGVYILPNLNNGGIDNYLLFKTDFKNNKISIRLFKDLDLYLHGDNTKLKEKLLADVEEFKNKYRNRKLTIGDLFESLIFYKYSYEIKLNELLESDPQHIKTYMDSFMLFDFYVKDDVDSIHMVTPTMLGNSYIIR